MSTISLTINPLGSLTVSSVALSDSLAVYGIKRNSDSSVIVAAGTSVTVNVGNVWSYTTTLLDTLIDYTAAFKVTYSDASIQYAYAHIEGIQSQTNLRFLRRKIANIIGGFELVTTTSAAPDSATSVSSSLIDRGASTTTYDRASVLACNGTNSGYQRKVLTDSYIPTNGQLGYTSDWPAQMISGIELEIHQKMGAVTVGKMKGIRECINEALEILWTVDMVPWVTDGLTSDLLSRDLNTYDWLRQASQIIGVKDDSGYSPGVWLPNDLYHFQYDAERPVLAGPEPIDTTTYQIAAYRPLNTWIKKDGVWVETINGLVNDTDECLGDHVLITQVALYFVYRALAENPYEGQQQRAMWEAKASRQAVIAKNIKIQNSPIAMQTQIYRRLPTPGYKGILGY